MKSRRALACCLMLAACDKRAPPLIAHVYISDALATLLGEGAFGLHHCASLQKGGETEVIVGVTVDQCYKMQPAREFRGVWLDQFEGGIFFEGAHDAARVRDEIKRRRNERGVDKALVWYPQKEPPPPAKGRLVLIDFIGRETKYLGGYGRTGMTRSEILVDRVISARVIYQSDRAYIE